MNFAIIAAAGTSIRMNGINKILYKIYGKPVIYWTLRAFESAEEVNTIIVVVKPEELSEINKLIKQWNFTKVKSVIIGGENRQQSIFLGIQKAEQLGFSDKDLCVMHDGARPLIKIDKINKLIQTANKKGATVLAVAAKDTIKQVDEQQRVIRTLDRDCLWLVQTPQAVRFGIVKDVFERSIEENFFSTDEAGLLEHFGYSVRIIEGNYENIKITTPEDLEIVKAFLRKKQL